MQEFCRVLFDAIDQSFNLKLPSAANEDQAMIGDGVEENNSKAPTSMSEMYEGVSQGFVKCLKCGYESLREDRF